MTPSPELIAQALAIADSTCRSDIECFTVSVGRDPGARFHWYNLASADEVDQPEVDRAERYLEARGLLIRDPDRPCVVTFRESA